MHGFTKQQGTFEQQIAEGYLRSIADRPQANAGGHELDKTDLMLGNLVTQGIYNLAIMGMRIKDEMRQQQLSADAGLAD